MRKLSENAVKENVLNPGFEWNALCGFLFAFWITFQFGTLPQCQTTCRLRAMLCRAVCAQRQRSCQRRARDNRAGTNNQPGTFESLILGSESNAYERTAWCVTKRFPGQFRTLAYFVSVFFFVSCSMRLDPEAQIARHQTLKLSASVVVQNLFCKLK